MKKKIPHSFNNIFTRCYFIVTLASIILLFVLLTVVRPTLINSITNDYANSLSEFRAKDVRNTLLTYDSIIDITDNVNRTMYLIAFTMIVATILLWLLMRSFALKATRSISELSSTINSINQANASNKVVDIKTDIIEIESVKIAVNSLLTQMADNLNGLESKVKERTVDLAKAIEINNRSEAVRHSLLMNLSHDLITPLSALLMYLDHSIEVIEECNKSDSKALPFLTSARHSSDMLWNEITTFLQHSKSTDPSESIVLTEFAVSESALRSIDKSKNISLASNNNVSYVHEGREAFCSSKMLFEYVLDNLIANSNKACKNGEISISTYVGNDSFLKLTVYDTGVGIPIEEREHIFEKHIQLDNTPSHDGPRGMGIGLSLAKFWIDLLGGSIGLESIEGDFSKFTISIREDYLETHVTNMFV